MEAPILRYGDRLLGSDHWHIVVAKNMTAGVVALVYSGSEAIAKWLVKR